MPLKVNQNAIVGSDAPCCLYTTLIQEMELGLVPQACTGTQVHYMSYTVTSSHWSPLVSMKTRWPQARPPRQVSGSLPGRESRRQAEPPPRRDVRKPFWSRAERNGAGRGLRRTCCAVFGPDRAGCGLTVGFLLTGPVATPMERRGVRWAQVSPGRIPPSPFSSRLQLVPPSRSCCRKEAARESGVSDSDKPDSHHKSDRLTSRYFCPLLRSS